MKVAVGFLLGGLCLVWLIWGFFYWGNTSDYDTQVSAEDITSLFASRGLEVCRERAFNLEKTPGFVEGRTVTVSTNCDTDVNPMRVSLLQFDSVESRNAATQRVATTHRNGFGPHFAYNYGPYVITVQGTRSIGDQLLLGKILDQSGATP